MLQHWRRPMVLVLLHSFAENSLVPSCSEMRCCSQVAKEICNRFSNVSLYCGLWVLVMSFCFLFPNWTSWEKLSSSFEPANQRGLEFLLTILFFYVPVATKIGNLMYHNTASHIASGDHHYESVYWFYYHAVLKRRPYIYQLPGTSGDNDLNFVGFLLKACGTQNAFLHLIDTLSNFSYQILLICLIELATDASAQLQIWK